MNLWAFHFTLVYFKQTLEYNGTTPDIFSTKVLFLVNDNCATSTTGFGKCITYDPSANTPSF